MRFRFTELPEYIEYKTYLSEIKTMSDKLMKTGLVHSVFQVGSVSNPGISDIDLMVIFKDNVEYTSNPVSALAYPGNYLFTHRLFGTSKHFAAGIEKFTFFNNYKLIAGDNIKLNQFNLSSEEISFLKPQIALEYLIKAFIAIQIGIEYRTIKLRSFLLHAKAIKYDFEFLGITDDTFHKTIDKIIELRSVWFDNKIKDSALEDLIISYRNTLLRSIELSMQKHNLYLMVDSPYTLSRNIKLVNSNKINFERQGLLPMYLVLLQVPYIYKILNRINYFKIHVPYKKENLPPIIHDRHNFMVESFLYNKKHLPNFICTGHGLNTFS